MKREHSTSTMSDVKKTRYTYIFDEGAGLDHGVVAGDIRPGQFSLLGVSLILLILVALDILGVKLDFVNLNETLGAGEKYLGEFAFAQERLRLKRCCLEFNLPGRR